MRKKKAEQPSVRNWPQEVERACRDAVSNLDFPGAFPELAWCEAVADGLAIYLEGIKMRIQELKADEES